MSVRTRQLIAALLSIFMMLGHLGSAAAQGMKMPVSNPAMTHMQDHDGPVAHGSMSGRHMSSPMPGCAMGHCIFCDGCVAACVGLLYTYSPPVQYPSTSFDGLMPHRPYPPLLVFPFFRPPGHFSA